MLFDAAQKSVDGTNTYHSHTPSLNESRRKAPTPKPLLFSFSGPEITGTRLYRTTPQNDTTDTNCVNDTVNKLVDSIKTSINQDIDINNPEQVSSLVTTIFKEIATAEKELDIHDARIRAEGIDIIIADTIKDSFMAEPLKNFLTSLLDYYDENKMGLEHFTNKVTKTLAPLIEQVTTCKDEIINAAKGKGSISVSREKLGAVINSWDALVKENGDVKNIYKNFINESIAAGCEDFASQNDEVPNEIVGLFGSIIANFGAEVLTEVDLASVFDKFYNGDILGLIRTIHGIFSENPSILKGSEAKFQKLFKLIGASGRVANFAGRHVPSLVSSRHVGVILKEVEKLQNDDYKWYNRIEQCATIGWHAACETGNLIGREVDYQWCRVRDAAVEAWHDVGDGLEDFWLDIRPW